jgi:23S rRNA pseudouridine2457 synthase
MFAQVRYFAIYKPYNMLSQFTDEGNHTGLGHLYDFPKDIYPVGRLDADSEGLLLLTNDNFLKHRLLEPKFGHQRTYWVQAEGIPTPEALAQLRQGVIIRIDKKDHKTLPAQAQLIPEPDILPERNPPIRYRADIPTAWLSLSISEGKNRQVRRMTAAVGFPTLRLVRYAIEDLVLGNCKSGEVWELEKEEVYQKVLGW